MKRFSTEIEIAAPPELVWAILSDAKDFPSWNTTVTRVEGTIAHNENITVHAKISPDRAFPARVEVFDAPSRMVWASGMPLGAFRGSVPSR